MLSTSLSWSAGCSGSSGYSRQKPGGSGCCVKAAVKTSLMTPVTLAWTRSQDEKSGQKLTSSSCGLQAPPPEPDLASRMSSPYSARLLGQ